MSALADDAGRSFRRKARERFVRSGALQLNVVEWGADNAPPLILLHGLRGDARTWERTAAVLGNRYRLIALDQRGRGRSDWDPTRNYFTPAYVTDLKALVDELELQHFVLLGHSMGGSTSLIFTQRYPERVSALIVEDVGPGSSAASAGADRIRREMSETPLSFDSRGHAADFWRRSRPGISDAAIRERLATMLVEREDGRLGWRIDFAGIAAARLDPDPAKIADLWPAVRSLACPTLVLRGERSDFLSRSVLYSMVEANPNIQGEEIGSASHYVHDDNFPDFIAATERFLGSAQAARESDA